MRVLAALSVLWCCLVGALSQCESPSAVAGRLFSCQLAAAEFFQDLQEDAEISVEFKASLEGRVGLPSWLVVHQPSLASPAYLYGTPPHSSDKTTLAITIQAQRKDTFDLSVRRIDLIFEPAEESAISTAQLYITNQNIEDFLAPANLQTFLDTLRVVLDSSESWILTVTDPSSISIPVPPPPSKHGVVVVVTPGMKNVTMATDEASLSVQEDCNSGVANPPMNFDLFKQNGFNIDWCQYQVEAATASMVERRVSEEGGGEEVEVPDEKTGSVPLVIVVVVCVVVIAVLVVGIGCFMFGGRRQSLAQKGNVKLAVLHMTREEGRQQTAAQTTLRDLARLPRARNRHTTAAAAAEDAPQEEGSETELTADDLPVPGPVLPPTPAYRYPLQLQ